MSRLLAMALGAAIFLAGALEVILFGTHVFELIEKALPSWMEPMLNPVGNWITMVVGILIFAAAWNEWRKEQNEQKHKPELEKVADHPSVFQDASSPITHTANPVITANPSVNQTVNLGLTPEHLASLLPEQTPLKREKERPRSKLVLKNINTKTVRMIADGDYRNFIEEVSQNGWPAVVARFKNEAQEGVQGEYFEHARADISFFDSEGKEIQDVARACWLGEKLDLVHFGVNDSHSVILAARLDREFHVPYFKRVQSYEGDYLDITTVPLNKEAVSARVSVTVDDRIVAKTRQIQLGKL
jgi:hypothetical protein